MDYTRTHRSTTQAYATPLTLEARLEGLNYEEECLLFSSMHREAVHTEEDYLAQLIQDNYNWVGFTFNSIHDVHRWLI